MQWGATQGSTGGSQESEREGGSVGKGRYCGFCRKQRQGRESRLRIR